MAKQSWWTKALRGRRPTAARRTPPALRPRLDVFEDRLTPALSDPFLLAGDAAPAPAAGRQQDTRIAAGAGGFLTVWADDRSATSPHAGLTYFGTGLGTMSDVYAARLDAVGNVIDTTPIVVTQAEFQQTTPRVAFNGQHWLVAWQAEREGDRYKTDVMAVRIAPDGAVLDRTPILVAAGLSSDPRTVWDVATDGSNWVVTWKGVHPAGGATVQGARISPEGAVLDPGGKVLRHDTYANPTDADIAFAGDEYLLTWIESGAVRGQRLTPTLDPVGGVIAINATGQKTAVGTDGTDFLVTWIDYPNGPSWAAAVHGKRVSHAGQVLDADPIWVAPDVGYTQPTRVDVTWDGSVYVVAYERDALGTYNFDIFTAHVAATGQVYDPGGRLIVGATNHQTGPSVAPKVGGGVQVVWTDNRTGVADVRTASMSSTWAVGPDQPVALGAPRQTSPVMAAGSNGFLSVFTSEIEGVSRVLAQRLDTAGRPVDAEPVQLGTGGSAAVAWNESAGVYLATWTSGGQVLGGRVGPDGAVLDTAPVTFMAGGAPDVAALGDQFLVTAHFREWSELQYTRAVRVGSNGQPVGTPVKLGVGFDVNPRVEAVGSRWLVVWEQNPTHDNTNSRIAAAFVNPDGTSAGKFDVSDGYYPAENAPDVASSGDTALIVWEYQGTRTSPDDIHGRRIAADGTFVDPGAPLVLSNAPYGQYAPRAAWNGTEFVVTWLDQRNEGDTHQARGDVYATHLGTTGPVADRAGFAVAATAAPEDTPSVAGGHGRTLFGYSPFVEAAPYANLRVTLRTATEFPAPQPPPAAPASLTATAVAYDAVDLAWSPVTGADGYLVERSPTGTDGWAQIASTRAWETTFRNTGLTASTAYHYRVRAYSFAGEGAYSPTASVTTPPMTPPAAPAEIRLEVASASLVRVWWSDVMTETGYEVWRSADGGATWALVPQGPVYSLPWVFINDTGVAGDRTYSYRVRGYNAAGFGEFSATATVTPPLAAPTGLTATAVSMTRIDLAWSDLAGESGYKVERSLDGGTWAVVATTEPGVTTFSDTGLVAGTTYSYRVRGFNATGDGDASFVASARTLTLAAPTGVTATAVSPSQVNLAWADISGEDGYRVERSLNGWNEWVEAGTTGAGVTAFSDTGVSAGTTYYYRVRGIAPGVEGDTSAVVSATTPLPPPPARPATLSATAVSSSQVKLSWSNVSGETGYWVWRSRDGKTWTLIGSTGADETTYTDSGLSARTTYYYRVQAYNAGGASAFSPVAKVTTLRR